jgi:uncharacterized protein
MDRIRTLARGAPLMTFVLLAYALSWVLWTPLVLGLGGGGGILLLVLGAFGPAVAAALVVRWTGGSLRDWLRPLIRWRVPGRYWLYALGVPPLLFAAVNLELALLGRDVDLTRLAPAIPAYLATFIVVALVGGGQEEPGWRGFALDRLQARFSPLGATLALAVIWGLWHLPIYGLAFVGPMMFAVYYTWLWNRTRSLLLCVLLHASFTPALDHLVLTPDSLAVDLAILGTLVGGAVILIALTRGRLGLDRPLRIPASTGPPAREAVGAPARSG